LLSALAASKPLLFVVEDNNYAISVKSWLQTPGGNIAANLASFRDLAIWDGSGVTVTRRWRAEPRPEEGRARDDLLDEAEALYARASAKRLPAATTAPVVACPAAWIRACCCTR
jgi:hypothetical protein